MCQSAQRVAVASPVSRRQNPAWFFDYRETRERHSSREINRNCSRRESCVADRRIRFYQSARREQCKQWPKVNFVAANVWYNQQNEKETLLNNDKITLWKRNI